ncbi:unnamed protein product [Lymnaea stagnalis]|uniref:24-hydroxycholesterol 7-alpha-hydroxylase n=1 Tax=Lymnaea stagnalis TaxID=6523 RepID=A0AAV2IPL9_LYMST
MFPWFLLATTLVVIICIYYVINTITKKVYKQNTPKGALPPIYSGWMPWLGCGLEFGKSPLTFIELMRQKYGPVYTLKVAGERMTFLTDPEDFHIFFRSVNVDFQKAVQNAVQNVASVTEHAFFRNHTKIHDTVKGRLAVSRLPAIGQDLFSEMKGHLLMINAPKMLKSGGESKISAELSQVVRSTMYKAVMNNLFGAELLRTGHEEKFKELEKYFVTFDDQFEYGARLPGIFLREWSTSKKWLLDLFRSITAKCLKNIPEDAAKQNLLQSLLSVVDAEYAPNWALLLLWASLANAIPITFWTLCLIYSHPEVLAKLRTEVEPVMKDLKNIVFFLNLFFRLVSDVTLGQMPYTRQCILEAIRLRSPGIITRRVVQEFTVKGFNVPAGDLLMVSPFWAHRNPKHFPEPDKFEPERWDSLDKNSFPDEFIAFGGGRYQCPGRWFALMEMQMYVSLFVNMFNCELLQGVPDVCPLHLVGTQQPVHSCPVVLTRRNAS